MTAEYSFNIFTYIKALYNKNLEGIDLENIQTQQNMVISKWLCYNEENLPLMKQMISYIWILNPREYFLLLALNLPKLERVPFLYKIEKEKEIKETILFEEIKKVFQWSNKELEQNRSILNKVLEPHKNHFKKELGI
jgi:hypothetical protein